MSKKLVKKQSSLLSFIKGGENRHLNAVTVDLTGDEDTQQAVAAPVLCQEIIEVDLDLEDDMPSCKKAKAVVAPVLCQEIIEVDSDSEDDAPLARKRAKVGVEEQGTFKHCSLNLFISHGIDCLGQFPWEMISWIRMAVAPSALPNTIFCWIASASRTISHCDMFLSLQRSLSTGKNA
jgi:hypothetical protein